MIAATDYVRAFADQIRALRAAALRACSAPTASAAATRRERLRALLRGRPPLRRGRGAARRSPTTARSTPATVRRRSRSTAIDPEQAEPATVVSERAMAEREVQVPDIGDFTTSTSSRCWSRSATRVERRAVADRARERQGHDGGARRRSPGVVKELRVTVGDKVTQGALIAMHRGDEAAAERRRRPRSRASQAPSRRPRRPSSRRSAAPRRPDARSRRPRARPRPRRAAPRPPERADARSARRAPRTSIEPRRAGAAARTRARRCASSRASSASISRSCPAPARRRASRSEDVQRYVKASLAKGGPRGRADRGRRRGRAARDRLREVRRRPSSSRCTAIRKLSGRTCTAAGSRSRTSRSSTRPTSPSSRSSARTRRRGRAARREAHASCRSS